MGGPPVVLAAGASATQAQAAISPEDRIIAYTLKGIAKAFVAAVDLDKLKSKNIEKLNSMSEEKFNKQYVKAYKVIRECDALALRYGFREETGKNETIKKIEALDKEQIYVIIDAIPDQVITAQFKGYLVERKQDFEKLNIFEQITKAWPKIIQKAQ